MKNIYLFLTCIYVINIQVFTQNDFNGEQLIQTSKGQNEITFEILDFNSSEPLIGAAIFSKEHNKVLSQTNIDGKATIEKFNSMNFRIDYIGYNSYCFNLADTTIDNIIVRLLPAKLYYGDEVDPYKGYSLNKNKNLDSIKDLDSGIIQLYSYTRPTNEQIEIANNYGFTFIINNEKSIDYIFKYNEEVLNFLSNKYQTNIQEILLKACWKNE